MKYVLSRVNRFLSATDEHRIDFNTVNIEHVLPQNPHKDLKLEKTDIKDYVHKLGNLTLLSRRLNSKVQNAPPAEKIPELEKSELAVTKVLVQRLKALNGKWDRAEIMKRQEELSGFAFNHIWKL